MTETSESSTTAVSAVICTHNGADRLPHAVASLCKQDYAAQRYEIIVVDNASTDDTKRVVGELANESAIKVRYIYEPKLGLANARNTGVQAAAGDIVALIDDDAVADARWLSALMDIYREHGPACVGGPVVAQWPRSPPAWLAKELHLYLTIVDMGDSVRELFGLEYPAGTNISFKKAAVLEVGGFDPRFGRKGSLLLSGEEDDLCARLETAGYRRFYTPHAIVDNPIPEERLTRKWFLSRGYWQGRTSALRGGSPIYVGADLVAPDVSSALRWLWALVLSAARRDAVRLFLSRFCLAYIRGVWVGRFKKST